MGLKEKYQPDLAIINNFQQKPPKKEIAVFYYSPIYSFVNFPVYHSSHIFITSYLILFTSSFISIMLVLGSTNV